MVAPLNPFPPTNGALVRIVQIYRRLSKLHDVVLMFPLTNDETDANSLLDDYGDIRPVVCRSTASMRSLVSIVSLWPYHVRNSYFPEMKRGIEKIVSEGDFSLAYCHFIYTLPYVIDTELPIVLDQHNFDREYWQRKVDYYWLNNKIAKYLFARVNLAKTVVFEESWLARVRAIVSVSERDSDQTEAAIPNANTCFLVAPNGVDVEHYARKKPAEQSKVRSLVLGFLGSLDLELNQEAAFTLCQSIYPQVQESLPEFDISILVIGRNPSPDLLRVQEADRSGKIVLTGTVDDVLPYLQQVDILLLPLESGAGTKLRVFEAMAAEVCIIGTSYAFSGIDGLVAGEHVFRAESIAEFVQQTSFLAQNPEIRSRVVLEARRLVVERYSWDKIVGHLSNSLVEIGAGMLDVSV